MFRQLLLIGRTLPVALAQAWMWLPHPHPASWPGPVLYGALFGTSLVLAFIW